MTRRYTPENDTYRAACEQDGRYEMATFQVAWISQVTGTIKDDDFIYFTCSHCGNVHTRTGRTVKLWDEVMEAESTRPVPPSMRARIYE